MAFTFKPTLVFAAGLALTGCLPSEGQYQGLSPMHRAEVSLTRFAHDMRVGKDGRLTAEEQSRLFAFFQRVDVRYGDEIQLDAGAREDTKETAKTVDAALYPYGLKVAAQPIAIGDLPAGDVVRVVITRHLAKAPGCPNNSQPNTPNYANAATSNFSCAVRTNLAAQVADPADLVGGKEHAGTVSGEPERAIDNFRTRELTGTQQLQSNSTGDAVGGGAGG